MSTAEFDAIGNGQYERGFRYELVDGVLTVNPIPGSWHTEPLDLVGWFLKTYQRTHANGSRIDSTMPE